MQHRIIAIDLGANTGWAAHPKPGCNTPGEPIHGSFRLPAVEEGDTGAMLKALRAQLLKLIAGQPVASRSDVFGNLKLTAVTGEPVQPLYDLLIYEAAVPFGGGKGSSMMTNQAAIEQQYQRGGCVSLLCAELGLQCFSGHIQRVRKHFLGHGRPDSPKEAVMAMCRKIGWYPADHDAGDALAMFDFACHMVEQPFRRAAGPMFFQSKAEF